ncbi:hypothetical protein D6D01_09575 [Aureobasidium pullulans]|uniref:Uncharacterized protein n=1 Tax=Aureobasidium pullulans TaxID=5580 RepID=A0A4S9K3C9_AURPU|nr:hypothetical protein D6D01_09575 [Aureobasidium pullulans]
MGGRTNMSLPPSVTERAVAVHNSFNNTNAESSVELSTRVTSSEVRPYFGKARWYAIAAKLRIRSSAVPAAYRIQCLSFEHTGERFAQLALYLAAPHLLHSTSVRLVLTNPLRLLDVERNGFHYKIDEAEARKTSASPADNCETQLTNRSPSGFSYQYATRHHFGPHVKELTLVVMRSRYTGYKHIFGLREGGKEKEMHASDKKFVVSGLYGQLMEKIFIVAHSYGNRLAIRIKKLPGTARGWLEVPGSEEKYPESYALARTLDAARRAGVSPPDFHVETDADSDHMENTIINHLGSQDDQSFTFSLRSGHAKVMYDHRQKRLKLTKYGVSGPDYFSALITRVVETLPAQMAIAKVEVKGLCLTDINELTTNVLQPLLPQLKSVEFCWMYELPMGTVSSIMKFLAEAPKLTRFVFSPDPICRYHDGARGSLEYEGNDLS